MRVRVGTPSTCCSTHRVLPLDFDPAPARTVHTNRQPMRGPHAQLFASPSSGAPASEFWSAASNLPRSPRHRPRSPWLALRAVCRCRSAHRALARLRLGPSDPHHAHCARPPGRSACAACLAHCVCGVHHGLAHVPVSVLLLPLCASSPPRFSVPPRSTFFLTLAHLAAIGLHWQHPHLFFSPSRVISCPGTLREMRAESPPFFPHSSMADHRSTIPRGRDRIESAPRASTHWG
ncbi:hypothetical protein B0H14DRAFT_167361 [Mycena olivaceomarginata]|nr:hypothetical protein B0H14DRAFT_167361 [Mycena olivaceomarginata]